MAKRIGDVVGYLLPGTSRSGDRRGKKEKNPVKTTAFGIVLAIKQISNKEFLTLEIHTLAGVETMYTVPEDQTRRTADTWHNRT